MRSGLAFLVSLSLTTGCGDDGDGTGSSAGTESTSAGTTSETSQGTTATGTSGATSGATTAGTTTGGTDECMPDPRWTEQEIGLPGPRALAADGSGTIHLLASPNTGDVEHWLLGDAGFGGGQVIMPGLAGGPLAASDASGQVHVLIADGDQTAYLTWEDAQQQWAMVMDAGAHSGSYMAVGSDGVLHVVGNPAVYQRREVDGTWLDPVSIGGGEGHAGIAMMNDAPLVCFSDATGHKQCSIGNPDGTFPAPTDINEFANFMEMDGPGDRAYLYLNRLHNGTTWEAGLTILEGTNAVDRPIIEMGSGIGIGHMRGATGPGERPHAAYVLFVDGGSGDLGLRHATRDGDSWDASWATCGLDTSQPDIAASDTHVVLTYNKEVPDMGTRMFVAIREL